ncbi:MAG: hypothetical protein JRJ59_11280 [Deltaproteobacteria bacterium]|nr:hypothetical protein [Deltaproteobacteria bacterium]
MTWFNKFRHLVKDEAGLAAVIVALCLPALAGLTGAAVDLGLIFSARAELQNAADAAALAAAAEMIAWDEDNRAIAQPEEALAAAHAYAQAHTRVGLVPIPGDPDGGKEPVELPLSMRDQDFTIGHWDHALGDFDYTGFSDDPNDLTAVRVKLRRDSMANSPVSTFFAKLVGVDDVPLAATCTGFLGFAGSVPPGDEIEPPSDELGFRVLPIAVNKEAVVGEGGGVAEGHGLIFYDENSETAEWTTFFTWPANDPNVKRYITGQLISPLIKVGDVINVINGNLSNNTFRALEGEFKTPVGEGGRNNGTWEEPEPWLVILPVVDSLDGGQTQTTVVGFLHFYITEVNMAPDKYVAGYVTTQRVIPNSLTGGGNYGTRSTRPVMIN